MIKEAFDYITGHHMLHPGDRVVVGVSGGADSLCLLHVLSCLKESLSIELRAVHVHHGLRGTEADRDAAFTETVCEDLAIKCYVEWIHVDEEAKARGISVEEAGRLARYRILEAAAETWEGEYPGERVKIAVAHHKADSVETILLNLFRGSGLKGLSGISPLRGRIIRPLLWAGKEEILDYLKEESLNYVTDSTNAENEYARNRIRNQILPLITSEINAGAAENILRAGSLIEKADAYFEKRAEEWLELWDDQKTGCLPVQELIWEEEIVRGYIIRRELLRLSCPLKDITAGHIEDVLSLLQKQTGKQICLPDGILARREYDKLIIVIGKECGEEKPNCLPKMKTQVFSLDKQKKIPKNQYTKWFDYDKIENTLAIRFRQTGDYITLPGGKKKTVKSFMIDEKIPASQRGNIALLAEGNHIIWIIGYRISDYYKITEHTERILEIQIDGGTDIGRQD